MLTEVRGAAEAAQSADVFDRRLGGLQELASAVDPGAIEPSDGRGAQFFGKPPLEGPPRNPRVGGELGDGQRLV
ncbi:MAG: hypothetical protein WBA87_05800 [Microbacterium sp.]